MSTKRICLTLAVVLCLSYSTASASLSLPGHANSVNGVSGSVAFTSVNPNLGGTIDYAVFTAAYFKAHFGNVFDDSSDVVGHDAVGPLVYAYQINNVESDAVSSLVVGTGNVVTDVGWAAGSGTIAPSNTFSDLGGMNPTWSFLSGEVSQNQSSELLVFSSAFLPVLTGEATIADGGTSATADGLAAPGTAAVPEPSTLIIHGCLACLAGLFSVYRRKVAS